MSQDAQVPSPDVQPTPTSGTAVSSPPPTQPSPEPSPSKLQRYLAVAQAFSMAFFSWLAREGRAVFSATVAQTGRLIAYGKALWRSRELAKTLETARHSLGLAVCRTGSGDTGVIERIAELTKQIESPDAKKAAIRPLKRKRQELTLRLADAALAQDVPPAGAEAEYQETLRTHTAISAHDGQLASLRSSLLPPNRRDWRRVGVGYGTAGIAMLAAVVLASHSRQHDDLHGQAESSATSATANAPPNMSAPADEGGEPAQSLKRLETSSAGVAASSAADTKAVLRPIEHDAKRAFGKLQSISLEMASMPKILSFAVVGTLDDGVYEITIEGQHALLRTQTVKFTSTGPALLPVTYEGTTTVRLKSGFEAKYPLYRQAMSDAGAFGLTADDVRQRERELYTRAEAATRDVVLALLAGGYTDDSVETLTRRLGATNDREEQQDVLRIKGELDRASKRGYGPIHYAIQLGDVGMFRSLVQAGHKPGDRSRQGATVVHVAVMEHGSDLRVLNETLTTVLATGAKLDEQDANGQTVLHLAVEKGNPQVLQKLVQLGAKLNAVDKAGATPLNLAVLRKDEIVDTLLELGADVNARDTTGRTPLHVACELGKSRLAQKLLAAGAVVNAADAAGQTPLHIASRAGKIELIEVLTAKGADRGAKDKAGMTPARLFKGRSTPASLLVTAAYELGPEDVWSLIAADGTIYAGWTEGGVDAHLRSLSADGKPKWEKTLNGHIGKGFVGPDATIYFSLRGTTMNTIALSANGKERWRSAELPLDAAAADQEGNAYFTDPGGDLVAIDSSGKTTWRLNMDVTHLTRDTTRIGPDGTIYVFGCDANGLKGLVAVTASGKRKWFFAPWTTSNNQLIARPAVGRDGTVYAGFDKNVREGCIFAITPHGEKKWEYLAGMNHNCDPCVGADGTVYVVGSGKLFAISPQGVLRWKQDCTGPLGPVLASDGSIYTASNTGKVVKVTAGGERAGEFEHFSGHRLMDTFSMGPNQLIYYGINHGKLYLIDTKFW